MLDTVYLDHLKLLLLMLCRKDVIGQSLRRVVLSLLAGSINVLLFGIKFLKLDRLTILQHCQLQSR